MRSHYNIHGVIVKVEAQNLGIHARLMSRLRAFVVAPAAIPRRVATIGFVISATGDDSNPPIDSADRQRAYSLPDADIWYSPATDVLEIRHPRVHVIGSPGEGAFQIKLQDQSESTLWLATHGFFTVPLLESLRNRGLFSLHAAGVSRDNIAMILVGPSGAGKSTLTVALVEAGWDFLSDDTIFIDTSASTRVFGFPDEIDLTPNTLQFWPSLENETSALSGGASTKRQLVEIGRVFGVRENHSAMAKFVVFCTVASGEWGDTTLEPVTRSEALKELHATITCTSPVIADSHRRAFERLVASCWTHRLVVRGHPSAAARLLSDTVATPGGTERVQYPK